MADVTADYSTCVRTCFAVTLVNVTAPRVAQSKGKDLVTCVDVIDEGVVLGNLVRKARVGRRVDVDANNLAVQNCSTIRRFILNCFARVLYIVCGSNTVGRV